MSNSRGVKAHIAVSTHAAVFGNLEDNTTAIYPIPSKEQLVVDIDDLVTKSRSRRSSPIRDEHLAGVRGDAKPTGSSEERLIKFLKSNNLLHQKKKSENPKVLAVVKRSKSQVGNLQRLYLDIYRYLSEKGLNSIDLQELENYKLDLESKGKKSNVGKSYNLLVNGFSAVDIDGFLMDYNYAFSCAIDPSITIDNSESSVFEEKVDHQLSNSWSEKPELAHYLYSLENLAADDSKTKKWASQNSNKESGSFKGLGERVIVDSASWCSGKVYGEYAKRFGQVQATVPYGEEGEKTSRTRRASIDEVYRAYPLEVRNPSLKHIEDVVFSHAVSRVSFILYDLYIIGAKALSSEKVTLYQASTGMQFSTGGKRPFVNLDVQEKSNILTYRETQAAHICIMPAIVDQNGISIFSDSYNINRGLTTVTLAEINKIDAFIEKYARPMLLALYEMLANKDIELELALKLAPIIMAEAFSRIGDTKKLSNEALCYVWVMQSSTAEAFYNWGSQDADSSYFFESEVSRHHEDFLTSNLDPNKLESKKRVGEMFMNEIDTYNTGFKSGVESNDSEFKFDHSREFYAENQKDSILRLFSGVLELTDKQVSKYQQQALYAASGDESVVVKEDMEKVLSYRIAVLEAYINAFECEPKRFPDEYISLGKELVCSFQACKEPDEHILVDEEVFNDLLSVFDESILGEKVRQTIRI